MKLSQSPSRPRSTSTRPRKPAITAFLLLGLVAAGVAVALSSGSRGPLSVGDPVASAISRHLDPDGSDGTDGDLGNGSVDVDEDQAPAVAKLDPGLREAVRRAATAAAADGIAVRITSGWRSRDYQQRLLDRAVGKYGSYAEARRWVSTPAESEHVTGDAVDIGPTDAAYWFSEHGSEHGLCQVYGNEIWHYELLTTPGGRCPPMRPDGSP